MTSAPVYTTRFKIVAAVIVAGVVAAFAAAYLSARDGGNDPVLSSGGADEYVEALIPQRNSQVPRQSPVGIDLVTGWDGALSVNGTEIPRDQMTLTPELGLIQFSPGPGQAVEELLGGQNCVEATVWPLSEGRANGARTVNWCFEVV